MKIGNDPIVERSEKQELHKMYDIGLVCLENLNIGNNLTNYALYQYLHGKGYRVLLIGNPLKASLHFPDVTDDRFRLFREIPYKECDLLTPVSDKWQMTRINQFCDIFVLGSDQLWRDQFIEETDFFTCLDWVESKKYKISYGTSFGIDYFEGSADTQRKMGYLLKRFQKISVREASGVKILKNLYGLEAERVLDPVFLCKKESYKKMSAQGTMRLPDKKYIGAYLLDPTVEKEHAVFMLAREKTDKEYEAMTQPETEISTNLRMQFLTDSKIEEWLAMIEHCDFLLTDSYHGLCFALIFQKQFCVLFDKENWRGLSRIQSLLDLLGLGSRLVEECDEVQIAKLYQEPIEYGRVSMILEKEREKSAGWLMEALKQRSCWSGGQDTYDYVWETDRSLYQRMQAVSDELRLMKNKNLKDRNDLFVLIRGSQKTEDGDTGKGAEAVQIIGWGAGDCFRRNIRFIKSFYDMEYVCDSNAEKWGKELEEHVVCISPEALAKIGQVLVIIMVDHAAAAVQIAERLLKMGIRNFEHVENWLKFLKQ